METLTEPQTLVEVVADTVCVLEVVTETVGDRDTLTDTVVENEGWALSDGDRVLVPHALVLGDADGREDADVSIEADELSEAAALAEHNVTLLISVRGKGHAAGQKQREGRAERRGQK